MRYTDNIREILGLLHKRGPLTAGLVSSEFKKEYRGTAVRLRKLAKVGLISKIGKIGTKGTYLWDLNREKCPASLLKKKQIATPSTISAILDSSQFTLVDNNDSFISSQKYKKFPQSKFVKDLSEKELENEFTSLIAVMLLTDGNAGIYGRGRNPTIEYSSQDSILHHIFADLIYSEFKLKPNYFFNRKCTTSYQGKKILKALEELWTCSPSFKTSPANSQTVEEYLLEPQPKLDFLREEKNNILIPSIRLAMSAEGCVYAAIHKNYGSITPVLSFACAHPGLVVQWKALFQKLGMKFRVDEDPRTWSGLGGLNSNLSQTSEIFLRIGGFVDHVNATRKSTHFHGLHKNSILKAILWAKDNIRASEELARTEKYLIIRKIAERFN